MPNTIDERLKRLNSVLSPPQPPLGSYVPFTRSGSLLIISGQLPIGPTGLEDRYCGRLGEDVSVENGVAAAKQCVLNMFSQIKYALGDFSSLKKCLRLGGFVQVSGGFHDMPLIINGASDLLVEILGENGRHARAVVGVAALPLNCAVEIDAMFEIAC